MVHSKFDVNFSFRLNLCPYLRFHMSIFQIGSSKQEYDRTFKSTSVQRTRLASKLSRKILTNKFEMEWSTCSVAIGFF